MCARSRSPSSSFQFKVDRVSKRFNLVYYHLITLAWLDWMSVREIAQRIKLARSYSSIERMIFFLPLLMTMKSRTITRIKINTDTGQSKTENRRNYRWIRIHLIVVHIS